MKNIQNLDVHKEGYTDFCRQTLPPLKTIMSSNKWFFAVFWENNAFFEKLI